MSTTEPGQSEARPASRPLEIAVAVVICNLIGIAGAVFTTTDTAWYRELVKPSWQPPGWLFGPVWTLLYTLMGVSLARLWARRRLPGASGALGLFAAQLLLNGIWSPVFFGAGAIQAALGIIAVLVVVLAVTIRRAWRVDRLAGGLLLPYLTWVTFATALNAAIVSLNR